MKSMVEDSIRYSQAARDSQINVSYQSQSINIYNPSKTKSFGKTPQEIDRKKELLAKLQEVEKPYGGLKYKVTQSKSTSNINTKKELKGDKMGKKRLQAFLSRQRPMSKSRDKPPCVDQDVRPKTPLNGAKKSVPARPPAINLSRPFRQPM